MSYQNIILIGYGIFLIIILGLNLLYFFQVFRYRLRGDASLLAMIIHVILLLATVILGAWFIRGLS